MNFTRMSSHVGALALLCSSTFFLTDLVSAQSRTVQLTVSKQGKAFDATITSLDADDCEAQLYAAPSDAALQTLPGSARLISTATFEGGVATISAKKLSPLRAPQRIKSRTLSFRARVECGTENVDSLVVPLEVRTNANTGISGVGQWLKHLASRVVGSSFLLKDAFPNATFNRPVDIQHPGDGTNRLFIVEQGGKIYVLENNAAATKTLFLDISDRLKAGGEQGLLSMAFHPKFAQNGLFFVHYSDAEDGDTVIARYKVKDGNPSQGDASSEVRFLRVDQPFANHNGGQISFGPDGFFYLGLGDGGSGGDPMGNGQNRTTLLGKILRIDVDTPSGSRQYSIPSDNPFRGNTSGFREEIFAYGLRNPFKHSHDFTTGRLWVADVGQNAVEEVDIVENGKNYGWNTMEGSQCYNPSSGCDKSGLELPVAEYTHAIGQSITGGYVYRGTSVKALVGLYIFADFITGRVFSINYQKGRGTLAELADTAHLISSFGVDREKELYAASYTTGKILKFAKR